MLEKLIAKMLLWMAQVTYMICYQSNIFPGDQIEELMKMMDEITKEFNDIAKNRR